MKLFCQQNLESLKDLLQQIPENAYTTPSVWLSQATIGQHIRHILEFYTSLLTGAKNGIINYDKRERNLQLETDIHFAIYTIDKINSTLYLLEQDAPLQLEGSYSESTTNNNNIHHISTTLYRELAYCLEHSIHHQALIKVSLKEQHLIHLIDKSFGIAPATIRHQSSVCVQ